MEPDVDDNAHPSPDKSFPDSNCPAPGDTPHAKKEGGELWRRGLRRVYGIAAHAGTPTVLGPGSIS